MGLAADVQIKWLVTTIKNKLRIIPDASESLNNISLIENSTSKSVLLPVYCPGIDY